MGNVMNIGHDYSSLTVVTFLLSLESCSLSSVLIAFQLWINACPARKAGQLELRSCYMTWFLGGIDETKISNVLLNLEGEESKVWVS